MLLKCIAGVETADKGQIVLNDQVLFDTEKRSICRRNNEKLVFCFNSMRCFLICR